MPLSLLRLSAALASTVILLTAGNVRPDDRGPEVYTVEPRDTLWQLAEQFFSDPHRWHELWAANKHIKNPHWIYPGQQLRITYADAIRETFQQMQPLEPLPQPQRSLTAATDRSPTGYVDKLIDPTIPADTFAYISDTDHRGTALWNSVDQSIELLGLYRRDSQQEKSTLDAGLHYIARRNTVNWGSFRINLIALDENRRFEGANATFTIPGEDKSGLVRFSLEQHNVPLTQTITLNNIIGTHRLARYNPFRERPNLINYRFGAAEPDVLGASTQIKVGQTGLAVSLGKLGQSQGNLLPGFTETSGRVRRLQGTHVRDRSAFTAEHWQTRGQENFEDRQGFRLGYDRLIGSSTVLSLSAVGSGGQHAVLAGGSLETQRARHDFGSYYFEPNIVWLDQRIGDDNVGAFYRYQSQRAVHNWGMSVELRKDGLETSASSDTIQSTSAFTSVNLSRRLTRRSTLNTVYGFRTVNYQNGKTEDLRDHSLRSYFTTSHRNGSRSNVNAFLRMGRDTRELMLGYGWARSFNNDSELELSTSYRLQRAAENDNSEVIINTQWNKQFARGTYVSAGLGYNFGESGLDDNVGITSHLGVDQSLGPRLSLSLQLDYSREQTSYDTDDLSGSFFTDNQFDDNRQDGSKQFFALLSLRYQRGGAASPDILRGRGQAPGAGSVRGVVYVDANGDGSRQANEPGVPGVTVFLNSVFPVVTNNRGEYRFPNVGPGSHFLFVDESMLPLPWSLAHGEYTPLSVDLRRSTQIDIAVSPITLAESD